MKGKGGTSTILVPFCEFITIAPKKVLKVTVSLKTLYSYL